MIPLIILLILTAGQHSSPVNGKHTDKNFALIDDFTKNQKLFSSDTFDLAGQSTEGGELIAYHSKGKDYLVFDIWLFDEMGKTHATYWTDKDLHFKIIKRTDFKYDKPVYEKGYKSTDTTEYLSYSDTSAKQYNADKTEINISLNEKRTEWEKFFQEITKDLKIVK